MTACSRLAGAAAAGQPHHGEREHAFAVAGVGRALVPFGGLRIVALDAEPVGIELAQHRHRLGVAGKLRARGREIEGGLVEAALIGAVDEVDVGIVEGRLSVADGRAPAAGRVVTVALGVRRGAVRRAFSRPSAPLAWASLALRPAAGSRAAARRAAPARSARRRRPSSSASPQAAIWDAGASCPALSVSGLVRARFWLFQTRLRAPARSPGRRRSAPPWRRADRPR